MIKHLMMEIYSIQVALLYPIIFLLSSCAVVTGTAELMLDGVCAVTREKSYCAELPKPSEEPLVYLQRALNKLRDDVEADLKGFDSNTQKAEAILSFKNEDDFYIFPRSHVSDENTRAIEMKSNRALVVKKMMEVKILAKVQVQNWFTNFLK